MPHTNSWAPSRVVISKSFWSPPRSSDLAPTWRSSNGMKDGHKPHTLFEWRKPFSRAVHRQDLAQKDLRNNVKKTIFICDVDQQAFPVS